MSWNERPPQIQPLDLHLSNAGGWGEYISQYAMPDMKSKAFWKDVATRCANHPAVMFDIYNEPRDVSWDVWKNGGRVEEKDAPPYDSPGMQGLLNAVRVKGATSAVFAAGLDWGYDHSGIARGYAQDLSAKWVRGILPLRKKEDSSPR
ncbi:MAG: cellulase family glycosylhydrolase [Bacteroidota bacterium]